jgi:hypothetical protein
MDHRRRRIIAIIGTFPLYTGTSPHHILHARESIPIDPPVSQPPPPEIQRAEEHIKAALKDASEDKPISLTEIYRRRPELRSVSDGNVQLALRDLLWRKDIEEVDDKTPPEFRLVRSSQG